MSGLLLQAFDRLAQAPGGVARLRELILSLAVRGRLVSGNHVEGTPSTRAMAAEDAPFEIPAHWRWMTLDALQPEFQNGASSRGDPGGVPITVLRLADIKNWRVSLADTRQVPIRLQDIEKYSLRQGDILITRVNGSADIVGQFNLVEGELQAIYCDHFIRMRVRREVLDPKYLFMFGSSEAVRGRISNLFISTAGQKTVNQGHIGSLPIAVPPLSEQSRIVARVEELMRLCDALEAKGRLEAEQHTRLLDTLLGTLTDSATPEELAANWQRVAEHFDLLLDRPEAVDALEQMILQLAVRGLLVPRDPSDEPASVLLQKIHTEKSRLIAEGKAKLDKSVQPVAEDEQQLALPEGWSWTQLREIVVSSEAGWSPSCEETPRRHGRWGVLKVSAVSWGSFDSTANKELPLELDPRPELEVRDGDFLLSRANTADLVARSVLVVAPPPMLMLSDKIIRLKLSPQVDARYINLFNNGDDARIYYAERASGTSSSMKNVSREVVLGLPVALPPLAEQARIVARVTELRRLCADLRQRLSASQATQSRLAASLVESVLV